MPSSTPRAGRRPRSNRGRRKVACWCCGAPLGEGYRDRLCRTCIDETDPLQDGDFIEQLVYSIDFHMGSPEETAFIEAERERRILARQGQLTLPGTVAPKVEQLALFGGEGEASA